MRKKNAIKYVVSQISQNKNYSVIWQVFYKSFFRKFLASRSSNFENRYIFHIRYDLNEENKYKKLVFYAVWCARISELESSSLIKFVPHTNRHCVQSKTTNMLYNIRRFVCPTTKQLTNDSTNKFIFPFFFLALSDVLNLRVERSFATAIFLQK